MSVSAWQCGRSMGAYIRCKTGSEIGSRVDRLSQIGELKDASHLSVDASGDFGIFNQGMRERSLFRYSRDFDAICVYCLDSMFIVNDMRLIAPIV